MRSEDNPLDLNNFPEDATVIEDSSSTAGAEKVYECRFCSLKFYKSQALGGHMNRHRQERETETLNRARQLVFHNDSLGTQTFRQLDGQPIPHGDLHHQNRNMGDPNLYRPLYPPHPRLFTGSSLSASSLLSPPASPYQPFLYPSHPPPPPRVISYTPQYPLPPPGYFASHFFPEDPHYVPNYLTPPPADTNHTFIGAHVRHPFPTTSGGSRVPDMATSAIGRSRLL